MANEAESDLPFYAEGKVVKGFGRGSKHLGFPTGEWNLKAFLLFLFVMFILLLTSIIPVKNIDARIYNSALNPFVFFLCVPESDQSVVSV